MTKWTDSRYLLADQYNTASNLNVRIEIHRRFSTNKQNLFRWIFEQLKITAPARILEIGAGTGLLWRTNLDRVPADWHFTLTDLSPGMLDEARENIGTRDQRFSFQSMDAANLEYASESFDAVIANHMLYHVPDIDRALAEVARVLKPQGLFYASTVGEGHLAELATLVRRTLPDYRGAHYTARFCLENGEEQLSKHFVNVRRFLHDDSLIITEAEPLVAYVLSDGDVKSELTGNALDKFTRSVESEIRERGAIRVSKVAGMFEARKQ